MLQGQTSDIARVMRAEEDSSLRRPPEDAIRQELDSVLSSHEFRSSKRCQEFLRYVVDTTLRGQAENLKERTIGVDVFGRSATYDPSDDATVRVKAGEVRKRLGLYYAGKGAKNRVRIELPPGTYVPEFRWEICEVLPAETAVVSLPDFHDPAEAPNRGASRLGTWSARIGISIAVLALTGAAVLLFVRSHPAQTAVDRFWAPVLAGGAKVSLCSAFVPVYAPRDPFQGAPSKPDDFILLTDQFVGGGDMLAVSRIGDMLTRMNKTHQVKLGNDVSFDDLRGGPAVLIGYSYTRWQDVSKVMRFVIDTSHSPLGINDNGVTRWTLPNYAPTRQTDQDYAIISRVFHPDTRSELVEIAGITQYGTMAAAEMVTNPELLNEALRGAPADWQQKNVQLVLHVKVISGTPTSHKIIASHYW